MAARATQSIPAADDGVGDVGGWWRVVGAAGLRAGPAAGAWCCAVLRAAAASDEKGLLNKVEVRIERLRAVSP